MMSDENQLIVKGLLCNGVSAVSFKESLAEATHGQIRWAVQECCTSASRVCCNRTRVGMLVTELVNRLRDVEADAARWEKSAREVGAAYDRLKEASGATGPAAVKTPPAKPKRAVVKRPR